MVPAYNPVHGRPCLPRYPAGGGKKGGLETDSDRSIIPVTMNEARRLFNRVCSPIRHGIHHVLAWSLWRRRSQARARISHYRRRGHPEASLQY
ncbi:hypothetical protein E1265_14605 [Streptomyces sp. 8K308]|nr:hypothetical protein E1265_14605 [Streptomyces sp. 8K308]